ncbi:hypothetical protein IWX87_003102 [Polaromonas sp. CG_9.7]|nr:hypothetical protein [Polaromonas sp. CG_9.7]MDH6182965.1 hypothetical protein [Polaromonas sp. CG_23.6]
MIARRRFPSHDIFAKVYGRRSMLLSAKFPRWKIYSFKALLRFGAGFPLSAQFHCAAHGAPGKALVSVVALFTPSET